MQAGTALSNAPVHVIIPIAHAAYVEGLNVSFSFDSELIRQLRIPDESLKLLC